jgi:glycerol-3-phosphate O-acyltransferase
MLKNFDEREGDERRDIVFIPVGLNYDRVLEDRSQLLKLHPERRRAGRMKALATALGFNLRNLLLAAQGRWHRFGYACVNFGTPLSMRAWCREHDIRFPALSDEARHAAVVLLAERLMADIGSVVPVLPVSLVASLMVEAPARAWSEFELKGAAHARMRELEARGAHLYIPRQDQEYAFAVGLRMLTLRRLVIDDEGIFSVAADADEVLAYYANAIAHLRIGEAAMAQINSAGRRGVDVNPPAPTGVSALTRRNGLT